MVQGGSKFSGLIMTGFYSIFDKLTKYFMDETSKSFLIILKQKRLDFGMVLFDDMCFLSFGLLGLSGQGFPSFGYVSIKHAYLLINKYYLGLVT